MANKRIYYACHQAGIKADSDAGDAFTEIHGLQSASTTMNFQLEQVFELGQLSIYQNIEQIPEVQVSLTKVLDGYPLMYLLATKDALDPTLAGRSNAKSIFGMSIFADTANSATGAPSSVVQCSGTFVGSVSYSFPVDGNFTEEMTLTGNDRVWANASGYGDELSGDLPTPEFDGAFDGTDSPIGTGGVNRRQHLIFDYDSGDGLDVNGQVADPDATILPLEVHGISASGTNEEVDGVKGAHLTNIGVQCNFNREALNELGRFGPYHRTVTFPVEVTCEIQAISVSGDMVSGTEEGIYTTEAGQCNRQGNLQDRTIRIATCEGTRLYLGTKNKLQSVSYSGGDAGGGNVTTSFQYSTFNDLTVMHSGDPNENYTWSGRATYLRDV